MRDLRHIPYGTLSQRRRNVVKDTYIILSLTAKVIATLILCASFMYFVIASYRYYFVDSYVCHISYPSKIIRIAHAKNIVGDGESVKYNIDSESSNKVII